MITVSRHAKERALERFGIKEDKAEEKLISFLNNSVEIFCNGQGRAFENKKHGIVLITDIGKSNIVTVYHSKGSEVSIEDKEFIVKGNNYGILSDLEFRDIIFKSYIKKVTSLNEKIIESDLNLGKILVKISKIKKSLIKNNNKEIIEKKLIDLEIIESEQRELAEQKKLLQKEKNNLIKEISGILGFDLIVISDIKALVKYRMEGK